MTLRDDLTALAQLALSLARLGPLIALRRGYLFNLFLRGERVQEDLWALDRGLRLAAPQIHNVDIACGRAFRRQAQRELLPAHAGLLCGCAADLAGDLEIHRLAALTAALRGQLVEETDAATLAAWRARSAAQIRRRVDHH